MSRDSDDRSDRIARLSTTIESARARLSEARTSNYQRVEVFSTTLLPSGQSLSSLRSHATGPRTVSIPGWSLVYNERDDESTVVLFPSMGGVGVIGGGHTDRFRIISAEMLVDRLRPAEAEKLIQLIKSIGEYTPAYGGERSML